MSLHSDLVRSGKASAYETPGTCVLRRKGEPRCILLGSYLNIRGIGRLLLLRRESVMASDSRKYRSCRRRTALGEGLILSTRREPLERRNLLIPCRWPRMSSIVFTSRRELCRVSWTIHRMALLFETRQEEADPWAIVKGSTARTFAREGSCIEIVKKTHTKFFDSDPENREVTARWSYSMHEAEEERGYVR